MKIKISVNIDLFVYMWTFSELMKDEEEQDIQAGRQSHTLVVTSCLYLSVEDQ